MLGGQPQPDQPTPVLADQGDPVQVHDVEDQFPYPFDMARVAVVLDASRLVGTTEPDQVRAHDAMPGGGQHRNHLAVQK